MRLIDADVLLEKYEPWLEAVPYVNNTNAEMGKRVVLCDIVHELKYSVQTIAAVEVVRCNECTRYQGVHGVKGHAICKRWESNVLWDNFCSHGERRKP